MYTSRERVIRTLNHETVDRAPRELWALPGIGMFQQEAYHEMLRRFPADLTSVAPAYGKSQRATGKPYEVGTYTDEWGCVWQVAEPGVAGEVKGYPLADWSSLPNYALPWELLRDADISAMNQYCHQTTTFVNAGAHARPFERMQFLRGTENLLMDLAYGEREVYELRDRLHEFFLADMQLLAQSEVDGIAFMDDWGSQQALLISPEIWREFYKPLYKDYCDLIHAAGKSVFFHSDGHISAIYPDLIEIGVDALNSQLFCMDIEALGDTYGGQITFWGEIDRQHILPHGSAGEVRAAVQRVRRALDHGHGGVIAQCEWGIDTPTENVAAVFAAWNEPFAEMPDA